MTPEYVSQEAIEVLKTTLVTLLAYTVIATLFSLAIVYMISVFRVKQRPRQPKPPPRRLYAVPEPGPRR